MQIIIKQRDIEQAIRGYIAAQGINLAGKSVEINFTAGRKEAGLTAEIDIEDVDAVASTNPVAALTSPALASVLTSKDKEEKAAPAAVSAIAPLVLQEEPKAAQPTDDAEEKAEAAGATSLFG